jgi:predicted DNA-binding protein with PD1-like motif
MTIHRYPEARTVLARLSHGEDLLAELERLVAAEDARAGALQVIGAVQGLALGFYDQRARRYETLRFDGAWEIVAGQGNVSLADGRPFVHLHLVAAGPDGRTVGGHLVPGCRVFAAEATLTVLAGAPGPEREPDPVTGLRLWR